MRHKSKEAFKAKETDEIGVKFRKPERLLKTMFDYERRTEG